MKTAIYQSNPIWLDPVKNIEQLAKVIDIYKNKADVLFLPEMFNTAYIMEPHTGAEDLDDSPTVMAIQALLNDSNLVVAGTMPTKSKDNFHNTFVFIAKEGIIGNYHKLHLFTPAGETKKYTPGGNTTQVLIDNMLILPLVCYDLRFPYCSFQNRESIHDVLVYSANWPEKRVAQWRALLVARAIENQCYVVGINRVGKDNNGYEYPGNSIVVDFAGNIIIDLGNTENHDVIELSQDEMIAYRMNLPFINDSKL